MSFDRGIIDKNDNNLATGKFPSDDQRGMHGTLGQLNIDRKGNIQSPHELDARLSQEDQINAGQANAPTRSQNQKQTLHSVDPRLVKFLDEVTARGEKFSPDKDTVTALSEYYSETINSRPEIPADAIKYVIFADIILYCEDKTAFPKNVQNCINEVHRATADLKGVAMPNSDQFDTLKMVAFSTLEKASTLLRDAGLAALLNFVDDVNNSGLFTFSDDSDKLKILSIILLAANSNPTYAVYAIRYLAERGVDLKETFREIGAANIKILNKLHSLLKPSTEDTKKTPFQNISSLLHIHRKPTVSISSENSAAYILNRVIDDLEKKKQAIAQAEKAEDKRIAKSTKQAKQNLINEIKNAWEPKAQFLFPNWKSDPQSLIAKNLAELFFETDAAKVANLVTALAKGIAGIDQGKLLEIFTDVARRISASDVCGTYNTDESVLNFLGNAVAGSKDGHNHQNLIYLLNSSIKSIEESNQKISENPLFRHKKIPESNLSNDDKLNDQLNSTISFETLKRPHAHHEQLPSDAAERIDAAVRKCFLTLANESDKDKILKAVQDCQVRLGNLLEHGIDSDKMIKVLTSKPNNFEKSLGKLEALLKFEEEANKTTLAIQNLVETFFQSIDLDNHLDVDIRNAIDVFLDRGNLQSSINAAENLLNLLNESTFPPFTGQNENKELICRLILRNLHECAGDFLAARRLEAQPPS